MKAPLARRTWDLGGFVVLLAAPVLMRWLKGDSGAATTREELRSLALFRPTESLDIVGAHLFRLMAWFVAMFAMLVVFVAASFARDPAGAGVLPLLEGIMVVTVTAGLFAAGMGLMSTVRYFMTNSLEGELDTRLTPTIERPAPSQRPGMLVRLSLPTNIDILVALVFVSCFAPLLYP